MSIFRKHGHRLVLGTKGPWWWRRKITLYLDDISEFRHIMGGKSKIIASLCSA